MKLNKNQQEVFDEIKKFLSTDTSNCFILKGSAGTGKTFLLKYVADYCFESKLRFALLAPTGRAARILTDKTNYPASTIHSKIYSQLTEIEEEIETDISQFHIKTASPEESVFIIDECSLISDNFSYSDNLQFGSGKLLYDLIKFTGVSQKPDVKIIFTGDPAQLPPVNSIFSPCFSEEYLQDNYGLITASSELTGIVRQQKDSFILKNAAQIKKAIDKKNFSSMNILISGEVDLLTDDNKENLLSCFSLYNEEDAVMIAATNDNVNKYNTFIRSARFPGGADDIMVNDRLMVVVNNPRYKLFNGDMISVNKLGREQEEITIPNRRGTGNTKLTFIDAEVSYVLPDKQIVNYQCKLLLNLLYSKSPSLSPEEKSGMFAEVMERLQLNYPPKYLRKSDPDRFREMKNEYLQKLRTDDYLNALIVKFGYAVTCHKAQGGEWDKVFVDFRSWNPANTEDYFRWAYTAITRAKEKLYCIYPPGNHSEF